MGFQGSRQDRTSGVRFARALGVLLMVLPGCKGSGTGSAHDTVELAFTGRSVDPKGQGIPLFSLAVERAPGQGEPIAVTVTTTDGQYEPRVPVSGPAIGRELGSPNEEVVIQVTAKGYKTKRLTATADQLLVGEPNTLNVTLEPVS